MSRFAGILGNRSSTRKAPPEVTAPETAAPEVVAKEPSVTDASKAFVAAHIDRAAEIGRELAALVATPDAFVEAIEKGFAELGDPANLESMNRITPGLGIALGVRLPLMEAAHKAFKRETKGVPAAQLRNLVERLVANSISEIRWFGMWDMERLLAKNPDKTWELMRVAAHEATEWITVDTLAHPYATGILREPRRWSDLQAFVHSPSRWERRLVGSTIATLPHVRHAGAKDKGVASRGLMLIGMLIGDSEPDVQKALSWALRSLAPIDEAAVVAFVERETANARKTNDGNRAWVIRDTLAKLPKETAKTLKPQLDGLRRRPAAANTKRSTSAGAAPRPANSSREE
ncbi:MAG TPA: DNA alkylation repair protein [Candidatus Limnocylindrales bacterium]